MFRCTGEQRSNQWHGQPRPPSLAQSSHNTIINDSIRLLLPIFQLALAFQSPNKLWAQPSSDVLIVATNQCTLINILLLD